MIWILLGIIYVLIGWFLAYFEHSVVKDTEDWKNEPGKGVLLFSIVIIWPYLLICIIIHGFKTWEG